MRNSCDTTLSLTALIEYLQVLPDGRANGQEMGDLCPGIETVCANPGESRITGFREYWYSGIVEIPSRCDSWMLAATVTARSIFSTNLSYSPPDDAVLYATLNNAETPEVSSPDLLSAPGVLTTINNPLSLVYDLIDPQGDSLSCVPVAPLSSKTGCFQHFDHPYRPSFSPEQPAATTPDGPFIWDHSAHAVRFTPSTVSGNTICLQVKKWRNGRLLGTTYLEHPLVVVAVAGADSLALDVIPGSVKGAWYRHGQIEACQGQDFEFSYEISSLSPKGSVRIRNRVSDMPPGARFSYTDTATRKVLGTVAWRSEDTGRRLLVVRATDTLCSGIFSRQKVFTIPVSIFGLPDRIILVRDGQKLRAQGNYTSYQWYMDGRPIAGATGNELVLASDGVYRLVVSQGDCTRESELYEYRKGMLDISSSGADQIRLYPNPVSGSVFFVEAPLPVWVRVFSTDGRYLYHGEGPGPVDISGLNPGLYLVQVGHPDGTILNRTRLVRTGE